MDKTSRKLVILIVVLIFVASEISNIEAAGRVNQLFPCACPPQCICNAGISCFCAEDSPLTSRPHHGPEVRSMEPPMASP
ncbi:hypothetical protein LINGRAHAP2_LOCUS33849 [Linum grandiflorum]